MSPRNLVSHVGAGGRLVLYLSWTLLLILPQLVAVGLPGRLRRRIPLLYHRVCARIIGLRLEVRGSCTEAKPALFVGNHLSYADITVLASQIDGSFVAKAEVRGWPLFGFLARLQDSVFVDRRPAAARKQLGLIRSRLEKGARLILFAEGTSGDGNRVQPYKSSLFAAAGDDTIVQPFSVSVTRLDGMPIGRWLRPFYAWYGDMAMLPHLWALMGIGRLTIVTTFHDTVRAGDFTSRKALAEHCRRQTARGLECANLGLDTEGRPQWAT